MQARESLVAVWRGIVQLVRELDRILSDAGAFAACDLTDRRELEHKPSKLARVVRDDLCSGISDDQGVGVPETAKSRHVETGLDGERHAGLEQHFFVEPEIWLLMGSNANGVAGPVNGVVGETAGPDDIAGGAVDFLHRHAGAKPIHGRALRFLHDFECSLLLGRRPAEEAGALAFGPIAVETDLTAVDDDITATQPAGVREDVGHDTALGS